MGEEEEARQAARASITSQEQSLNYDSTLSASPEKEIVPSEQAAPPPPPPPPPSMNPMMMDKPNGGLQAWLTVLGGFMLFFNTWGILNAFGVFQTYYQTGALFQESSSNISWIGSIQSFMVLIVGFISGPIFDRGYLRSLLIVGSFFIVFGHMMLSLCHTYWQVLLAQGFCVGMGAGCLFVPSVSVLPTYFSTKLGLAVGLAAAGSSFGGIIYPIVLYRLIGRIGFAWSVRVIGFIALGTLLLPIAVMKLRFKPARARALVDWSAFTDFHFMLFSIATLIGFMGLYTILFYLSFYAENRHITSTSISFYLVAIFNAASCFGRTIPNALSDKTGPLNMITPGAFIVGVLILCMMAVDSEAGIIVVAVLAGFFSGVFIAMPPVCFVALTQDKSKIGTRIGMGFGLVSFGVLASGPGGGAILGPRDPLDWRGLWAFGGVSCCVAGMLYAWLRVARNGVRVNVKA